MKLILDGIIFTLQKHGGISVYWKELCKRAGQDQRNAMDVEITLYNNHSNTNQRELEHIPALQQKIRKGKFLLPLLLMRFLPFFRSTGKAVFHSSYLNVVMNRKAQNIITIHDLGHERKLTQTGLRRTVNLFFKFFALRKADGLICISAFTKQELLLHYPFCAHKPIRVIHNGVSDCFFRLPLGTGAVMPTEGKYILYVGTRYSYKRFPFLVEALADLPEYTLVTVGGGAFTANEKVYLSEKLGQRYVHHAGASDEMLNNLYNFAHCLVYPSEYEGFGIPLVEAMRAGCPFIACRNASIPEIAGNAGILLPADADEEMLREAIQSLSLPDVRNEAIEKGNLVSQKYSWDECYKQTLEFYTELDNN